MTKAVKEAAAMAHAALDEVVCLRSQNASLRDTCDIQRNQLASLERELAMIEAGYPPSRLRTPGTVEVCELCDETVLGGVPQESAICVSDNCPLRAHSPAAQEAE